MSTIFSIRTRLLSLIFWSLSVLASAQGIGGLPDPTFHVADSAMPLPGLNLLCQKFHPGQNGGLIAINNVLYRRSNSEKRKNWSSIEYYNSDLVGMQFRNPLPELKRAGWILESEPNSYHYFRLTNRFSSDGLGFFGIDSLMVEPFRIIDQASVNPALKFAFPNPLLGKFRAGLVQTNATQMALWLTHTPGDSLGLAAHTQTYVRLLDTSGVPLPSQISIPNFVAHKASFSQGKIYLLGTDALSVPPTAATRIVVLDASNLNQVSQNFTGLLPNMIIGDAQVFKVLADGKMLVAGHLFNGTNLGQLAMRLLPNGAPDNTFALSFFAPDRTFWHIDDQETIRCATLRTSGGQLQAALAVLQANGGFTITQVPLPNHYGLGQCLMFDPGKSAFLFQTPPLRHTYKVPDLVNGEGFYADSATGTCYRYFVGFNGNVASLVNHHGTGVGGDQIYLDVQPSITDRFLGFGAFTQANRKFFPALAMFRSNGELDTTFQPFARNQDDSLRFHLTFDNVRAHLTPSGKVLMHFDPTRVWNYPRGRQEYQDTIRRFLPDGTIDPSFNKIWHHGTLKRGKNGRYYGMRLYENGVPSPVPNGNPGVIVKGLELDEEGNFVREFGAFTSNGAFPDTTETYIRYRDVYLTDAAKALWIKCEFYMHHYGLNRTYYIRFDSTGSTRYVYPDFNIRTTPLNVEILPGNRMRWTGAFEMKGSVMTGQIVNVIETDSSGKMDLSVTPKVFYVPDAYGGRTKFYAAPHMYLPDGKILTYLNQIESSLGFRLIRLRANGLQDNSFMPIEGVIYNASIFTQGDRLLMGVQNINAAGFQYSPRISYVQNSFKNGIHAFTLKSYPANTGFVQGRVTQVTSPATGCNPGVPQRATHGMIIRSVPSGRLAISDTGGYYTIPLPLGNHTVGQDIQNNFLQRQVCPAAPNLLHSFNLPTSGSASLGNDFINQTYDCPRLDLKVLDPRFRLCSRTSFQIQYANDGVAPQPNARIRVNLPEEIRILSASRPYIKDADSSYVFDLGTLAPGAKGTIITTDTIACPTTPDSLARACFSARIEPLSLCSNIIPADIAWDGAWVDAVARYIPALEKVRVVVYNKGASMADSSDIRLTGSGLIYRAGKFKLAAGDSLVTLCEPAIHGSIQLRLNQTPACPLGSVSTLNHSGRGRARAFLNFGSGLLESYTVQACPVWRFSYDPNEKLVEPSGDIEPGTDLAYTIHFENYGNDTAYAVTVEDSLPPGLDMRTLRLGSSSHPFNLELAGTESQPILYFHFRDIKLTGKKQDSVLSKGQVSFRIRTFSDVPRGSTVSNRAHIYFDRNAPVITEYIHSPIAQLGIPVQTEGLEISPESRLVLAPNPASGSFRIWLNRSKSQTSESTEIRITSLDGRCQRSLSYTGRALEVKDLAPGIYTISAKGVAPQKLVVLQ